MKDDYIVPGMPGEGERVHQIWESNVGLSVSDARDLFELETDKQAIRDNDVKRRRIKDAAPDLLAALERAVKYIPHRNAAALAQVKSAISKAYNG